MVVRARLEDIPNFGKGKYCFEVGALQGRQSRWNEENAELFGQLWKLGYTCKQIMEVLGIQSLRTVMRWRNKLCIPPRQVGNHSRRRRKERGK